MVELIGSGRGMHYTHQGWRKVVYLALRYGWKPLGAKRRRGEDALALHPGASADPQEAVQVRTDQAHGKPGFDETTWAFHLGSTHGIPPNHPLPYCSDVLLYCEETVVESYFDHGRVSAADVRALADSLEKALPHIPEGPESFRDHKPGALFNPAEWFDPGNRQHVRGLIAFCKRGGFKLVP